MGCCSKAGSIPSVLCGVGRNISPFSSLDYSEEESQAFYLSHSLRVHTEQAVVGENGELGAHVLNSGDQVAFVFCMKDHQVLYPNLALALLIHT